MLPDSREVSSRLQKLIGQTIYVLADTAYERYQSWVFNNSSKLIFFNINFSCCIDYIAAAHINADAIIHFGPVCFSQTLGTIPYLNIYDKHHLDVDKFKIDIQDLISTNEVSVVLDTVHLHQYGKIVIFKLYYF